MIASGIELLSSLSIEQLAISVLGAVGLGWVAVRRVVAWVKRAILRFALRKAVALGIIGTGAGELMLPDGVLGTLSTIGSLLPI